RERESARRRNARRRKTGRQQNANRGVANVPNCAWLGLRDPPRTRGERDEHTCHPERPRRLYRSLVYMRAKHHRVSPSPSSSRFSVSSISMSLWADDMNAASNADGARYTPRSSAAWKKRLNRSTSDVLASANERTGSARKKNPHIEPAQSALNGTPHRV